MAKLDCPFCQDSREVLERKVKELEAKLAAVGDTKVRSDDGNIVITDVAHLVDAVSFLLGESDAVVPPGYNVIVDNLKKE